MRLILGKVFIICLLFAGMITCKSKSTEKQTTQTSQRGGGGGGGRQQGPQRVDVIIAIPQKITQGIEVPGTLIASETTEIHPEVSGRLTMLNVREGAYVGRGSVIAKLYDADLQAQLRKLQAQLNIANQTANRLSQLLKIQGISRQDYDMAVLNANNIRADIDIIRTNIARTVIRAPFSGKLGLKEISVGAYVTPSTIITVIRKTSDLRLDFTVPEKYISEAKPGRMVFFTVAGSDVRHAAKIMATESGITENSRSLNIRSTVIGNDPILVPGAFANVIVDFAPDYTAIMVPSQAIIPQARGKKLVLYKDSVATFVDVTTGVRDSSNVQILSGINAGDTIVTTGLMSVKPKAKLVIKSIIKPVQSVNDFKQ
ncbi:MAG TPA: efflux RND transporter periplasmic adaptor subunit [Chitinophagaceae bacterium]|nr:efflux RND transporter periplasmic adaptor subunit [Chitinophagaceae bacterium]